jgi:5-methylcytosine-specific restriction protein A
MFEKDKIYIRKELHDKYGGNRRSGISKSNKYNIIMLFYGNEGKSMDMRMIGKMEFFIIVEKDKWGIWSLKGEIGQLETI